MRGDARSELRSSSRSPATLPVWLFMKAITLSNCALYSRRHSSMHAWYATPPRNHQAGAHATCGKDFKGWKCKPVMQGRSGSGF